MERILEDIKAVLENIRRKLTEEERIILHIITENEDKYFYPRLVVS